jgi:hypothetical protein
VRLPSNTIYRIMDCRLRHIIGLCRYSNALKAVHKMMAELTSRVNARSRGKRLRPGWRSDRILIEQVPEVVICGLFYTAAVRLLETARGALGRGRTSN